MYRILLCDDEEDIILALKAYLNHPDYEFYEAHNGQEACSIVRRQQLDLIVMDIMMPVMDGITAMKAIREICNTPIILLSAKSEEIDKIVGLNAGADDYITKPFNPMEVEARVRSQLRRYMYLGGTMVQNHVIRNGGLELEENKRIVRVDGEEINLTPTEYEILKLFMCNPGKTFSPAQIYQYIWKDYAVGSEGTIAVHIRRLRSKIEINPADPRYIRVVWGQGYRMERI